MLSRGDADGGKLRSLSEIVAYSGSAIAILITSKPEKPYPIKVTLCLTSSQAKKGCTIDLLQKALLHSWGKRVKVKGEGDFCSTFFPFPLSLFPTYAISLMSKLILIACSKHFSA